MQFVFVALIFGTSYVYMCHIQHDYGHKLVSTVLSANGDLVEIGKHSVHCFNCTICSMQLPLAVGLASCIFHVQGALQCFMSAITFLACVWRSR